LALSAVGVGIFDLVVRLVLFVVTLERVVKGHFNISMWSNDFNVIEVDLIGNAG
jgi:hypothetical protein